MKTKKKIFFYIFIISCSFFPHIRAINTLSDISTLRNIKSEYPIIDNNNLLKPDYTTHYQSETTLLIDKLYDTFFPKRTLWSARQLKNQLQKITKQNQEKSYHGDFILKVSPPENTKVVIWGDLSGAFHSLIEDLKELNKRNVINNDLKITNKNVYFVFNGNMLRQSAYILETLSVILLLIEKNPDQVFYIKGDDESKGHWENWGCKEALMFKAKGVSLEKIPLAKELDDFLNTLPRALYITLQGKEKNKYIRISYFDRTDKKLEEENFAGFLEKKQEKKIDVHNLNKKMVSKKPIDLYAIIKAEEREIRYQKTDGLHPLFPDKGATAWSIFSAPIKTSQELYQFYNDAFVILTIINEKDNFITLYKQDARKRDGFTERTHHLLTEQMISEKKVSYKEDIFKKIEMLPEMLGQEIIIGSSMPLSGSHKSMGMQILRGIKLRFDKENEKGGVQGKRITFKPLDDEYLPFETVNNVKKIKNTYNTDIFLAIIGAENLQEISYLIEEGQIGVFFPTAATELLRAKNIKNLVYFRTPYSKEYEILTNYAIKTPHLENIVIFFQNDTFGKSGTKGIEEILKKNNIETYTKISYERDLSNFDAKIKLLKKHNPHTIFFVSPTATTKKIIESLPLDFWMDKHLFGNSFLAVDDFQKFAQKKGLTFIHTQAFPDIKTSTLKIIKNYHEDMQTHGYLSEQNSLEGYIYASIFIYLLQNIEGKIDKDSIYQQAKKIKNLDFEGLALDFNKNTNQLADYIWLKTEDGDIIPYQITTEKAEIEELKPEDLENKILIGSSLDLSASSVFMQEKLLKGLQAYIDKINKKGGIRGKEIKLVILDNEYDPEVTKKTFNTFLTKYKIDKILICGGTPPTKAIIPLVEEEKVLVAFPFTGANIVRKPTQKYFIHAKTSYTNEVVALVNYLLKKAHYKKFALFYQADEYGLDCLRGARKTLKAHGITDWCEGYYDKKTLNVDKAADAIKKYDPEVIMFFSTEPAAENLIRKLDIEYVKPKILCAVSFMSTVFREMLKSKGLKVTNSYTIPNPKDKKLEILQEYKEDLHTEEIEPITLTAYIAANMFVYYLKKIEGDLTKENFIREVEKTKQMIFKGLNIAFDPKTRELFKDIWIQTADDRWLKGDMTLPGDRTSTTQLPRKTKKQSNAKKLPRSKKTNRKTHQKSDTKNQPLSQM